MNLNIRDAFVCILFDEGCISQKREKELNITAVLSATRCPIFLFVFSSVEPHFRREKRRSPFDRSVASSRLFEHEKLVHLSYPFFFSLVQLFRSFSLSAALRAGVDPGNCCCASCLFCFHMPLRTYFHHQQSGSLILQCGTPSLFFVITVTVSSLDQRNLLLPITGTT